MASYFDKSSLNIIEKNDGFPVSVYLDENGWRSLTNPSKFRKLAAIYERKPPKTWRERVYYSSADNRGYLNEAVQKIMPIEMKQYIDKYFVLIPEVKCESEDMLVRKARETLKI